MQGCCPEPLVLLHILVDSVVLALVLVLVLVLLLFLLLLVLVLVLVLVLLALLVVLSFIKALLVQANHQFYRQLIGLTALLWDIRLELFHQAPL